MILISLLYAAFMAFGYVCLGFGSGGLGLPFMLLGLCLVAGFGTYGMIRLGGAPFGLWSEEGGWPAFFATMILLVGVFGGEAIERGEAGEQLLVMGLSLSWAALTWGGAFFLVWLAWFFYKNWDTIKEEMED